MTTLGSPSLSLSVRPDDTTKFRVGACALIASVDGKSVPISEFSAAFSTMGLPTAVIEIPIGKPVGYYTEPQGKRDLVYIAAQTEYTVAELSDIFSKYVRVKIHGWFLKVPNTDPNLGSAFPKEMFDKEFVLFEGFVSGTRIESSGKESVSFSVTLVHRLVSVASGVALFSNVIYGSGFYNIDVTPFQTYMSGDNVNLLRKHLSDDPYKIFTNLAKEIVDVVKARRGTNVIARSDPNAQRIIESFHTSVELLDEIKSFAKLRFNGTESEFIKLNMAYQIMSVLTNTVNSANLLANLIRVLSMLNCVIIFNSRNGYIFPADLFWPSSMIPHVAGGVSFTQTYQMDTAQQGYDITGTIACLPVPSDYIPEKNAQDRLTSFSSWIMPGLEPGKHNVLIDMAYYPSWLVGTNPVAVSQVNNGESDSGNAPQPKAAEDQKSAEQNNPPKTSTTEETNVTAQHYAFYNTMSKNTGNHVVKFMTGLRNDIIPGMNLALDTIGYDKNDAIISVYGYVNEVNISVSARRYTALTSVTLAHVRNQQVQYLIDKENRPHYAWTRVAKDVCNVKLFETNS